MKKFEQSLQGKRTHAFLRSDSVDHAGQFVRDAFQKLRSILKEDAVLPFLAFCNLNESFAADETSFVDAGFVTNSESPQPIKDVRIETLPEIRVLKLTTDEPAESRSAVHLELFLYAQVFHLKLSRTVYEYHFPGDMPTVVYTVEIL